MNKTLGIALLGLAACSNKPSELTTKGRLAVAPEFQAIVGGTECTANKINIVLGTGMYSDLSCPKGEFQSAMECPGFNIDNGQARCTGEFMHLTLKQNGRVISDKKVATD